MSGIRFCRFRVLYVSGIIVPSRVGSDIVSGSGVGSGYSKQIKVDISDIGSGVGSSQGSRVSSGVGSE